jgi:hypothetical protein
MEALMCYQERDLLISQVIKEIRVEPNLLAVGASSRDVIIQTHGHTERNTTHEWMR